MLYRCKSMDFTAERSCLTQPFLAINDWTNALDAGQSVDILYFDFSKAFDSVSHNCLISKLHIVVVYLETFLNESGTSLLGGNRKLF